MDVLNQEGSPVARQGGAEKRMDVPVLMRVLLIAEAQEPLRPFFKSCSIPSQPNCCLTFSGPWISI